MSTMTTNAIATKRKPVELVRVGEHSHSPVGWRLDVLEQHLTEHLTQASERQWCEVACMARTMLGRDSRKNRQGVRWRLSRAQPKMIALGYFVVIEYARGQGTRGEALACKLLSASASVHERQCAEVQLARMRARRDFTAAHLERARSLIDAASAPDDERIAG